MRHWTALGQQPTPWPSVYLKTLLAAAQAPLDTESALLAQGSEVAVLFVNDVCNAQVGSMGARACPLEHGLLARPWANYGQNRVLRSVSRTYTI